MGPCPRLPIMLAHIHTRAAAARKWTTGPVRVSRCRRSYEDALKELLIGRFRDPQLAGFVLLSTIEASRATMNKRLKALEAKSAQEGSGVDHCWRQFCSENPTESNYLTASEAEFYSKKA